jgi:very-short-patch-repair endonuclease
VISRRQLTQLGFGRHAIEHRINEGRLHRVRRGIYAIGRPELTRNGRWMAAHLAAGPESSLCHRSAAAHWRIEREGGLIDISLPSHLRRTLPGVRVHRRDLPPEELREKAGLRLTSPSTTLIDLATCISEERLERAINEADSLDLIDPAALLAAAKAAGPRHGARRLRTLLARDGLIYTANDFEQRLLRYVRAARIPIPLTQQWLCGYRVDFYWPDQKVVVEADSLRYHRTPSRQVKDARRDQVLTAAGYTPIRVPHRQLRDHPEEVIRLLTQLVCQPRIS